MTRTLNKKKLSYQVGQLCFCHKMDWTLTLSSVKLSHGLIISSIHHCTFSFLEAIVEHYQFVKIKQSTYTWVVEGKKVPEQFTRLLSRMLSSITSLIACTGRYWPRTGECDFIGLFEIRMKIKIKKNSVIGYLNQTSGWKCFMVFHLCDWLI